MFKPRAYIAAPVHGSGTQPANLRNSLAVAKALLAMGFVPVIPHLFLLWEFHDPEITEDDFMSMCLSHLSTCHVVVRVRGISPGADIETAYASAHNIPVISLVGATIEEQIIDLSRLKEMDVSIASIDDLQDATEHWLSSQPYASSSTSNDSAIGVIEEVGELRAAFIDAMEVRSSQIARSILKTNHGIRGTPEEHAAKMADAIGDIMIFAAGFAAKSRGRLRGMINGSLSVTQRRDWQKNPKNGETE